MKKFTAFAALAGMVALTACLAAFAQDKPAGARAEKPGGSPPAYPQRALDKEQSGLVEVGFLIGPDGVALDNFVATSSGAPDLDRKSCVLVSAALPTLSRRKIAS